MAKECKTATSIKYNSRSEQDNFRILYLHFPRSEDYDEETMNELAASDSDEERV